MNALVERLNRNAEYWIPTQAHILEAHNLVALAADRIEQLERVLALAREALEIGLENASQIAGEYHSAMSGYKQNRHDALDSDVDATKQAIAAIDEALK